MKSKIIYGDPDGVHLRVNYDNKLAVFTHREFRTNGAGTQWFDRVYCTVDLAVLQEIINDSSK